MSSVQVHEKESLSWTPPKLKDAVAVRELVQRSGLVGNDLNFANLFLLQNKHHITLCLMKGFLFRYYAGTWRRGYTFPIGGTNDDWALCQIERDAIANNRPLVFCLLTANQQTRLESLRPGQYEFKSDRGDADYLYLRKSLALLPGRAYHRKRNAITQFERNYPNWQAEPLTPKNLDRVRVIADCWYATRWNHEEQARLSNEFRNELAAERFALNTALEYFNELQLSGILLCIDNEPCAFAIVSATSDSVIDVHFEKALPEKSQAYTILCRETARNLTMAQRINREEDLNIPGLRKAKLSWFPEEILQKYTAVFHADTPPL